ncbi:MAG: MFS transporter [Thermomicrobiales bacterium]|nr:MFS transporter [Thermomicrobiales bacterium]
MSEPASSARLEAPLDNLPFRRDALTWLMYGMLGAYNYLLSGLGPLMPSLRQELRLSYTVTSLHFSAWAVGMILAGLAGDRLVRAWGRRAVFWLGAGGLALGAVALTQARQPVQTIGSVLLMSAVGSLVLVLIPAVLADQHGARRTLAIVEANILAAATGALAGVLIGLGQATPAGWRGPWLVILLVPLALFVRYRAVALPLPAAPPRPDARTRSVRLPAAYWAYWVTVVLVVGVEFSLIFWGADFLTAAGLGVSAAATTVSLFLWGMVAGRIVGRQVAQWLPAERLLPAALVVAAAGFFLYWLAPLLPLTVLGLFVAGLGVANLFPLGAALAMGAAPGLSNEAGARLSFASGAAILAAPLLLGTLADAVGIALAYAVVPVFLAGAVLASWLGAMWSRRQGVGVSDGAGAAASSDAPLGITREDQ